MIINKVIELELERFKKDFEKLDNQELDLIYDPIFDCVCERVVYNKRKNLIEWKCAICGCDILADKKRDDVENFVCDKCKESHNNSNVMIDRRILDSRTKMYKMIENLLYEELETNLSPN